MSGQATQGRDFAPCVDAFGNISVDVTIGGGPWAETREGGASAAPAVIAKYLRELAAAIEQLAGDTAADNAETVKAAWNLAKDLDRGGAGITEVTLNRADIAAIIERLADGTILHDSEGITGNDPR